MAGIIVNSKGITDEAQFIDEANERINNDFLEADRKNTTLGGVWEGSAAKNAMEAFNFAKSKYGLDRYNKIKSYTAFLKNVVSPDYCSTEERNASLSDKII